MNIAIFIVLFLIVTFVVSICFCVYVYLKRNRFTRERFAFFCATSLFSLASAILTSLYSSGTILSIIADSLNANFNVQISVGEPDWTGKCLSIVMFFGLAFILKSIHKDWDGGVSSRQEELDKIHEKAALLSDALAQLKSFFGAKNIIKAEQKLNDENFDIFIDEDLRARPWHAQAAELLRLMSLQYKIDVDFDWYVSEKCFVSKYGKNDDTLLIVCLHAEPGVEDYNKAINFARTIDDKLEKIIFAVRSTGDKKNVEYNGYNFEIRYEQEMLSSLVDFTDYYEYIEKAFTKKEVVDGCGFSIEKIYVESTVRDIDNCNIGLAGVYIDQWIKDSGAKRHLAILGEYGQGKSVLALKIAYDIIKNSISTSRIPIVIELRGKSPRNLSVLEILANWASPYRIEPQALVKLHNAGRLLLIFEGFDEIDLVGDAEMRLNHFQRLWEFAISNSKIMITGRPNFFLDDTEMRRALGIHASVEGRPYCEAVYLNHFSRDQIEKALRATKTEVCQDILAVYDSSEESSHFRDLISRPSTLFLVSVIWEDRKLSQLKESINSAFIINEFLKHSYVRQVEKRYKTVLTSIERECFMQGIAVGMTKNGAYSNQISVEDLDVLSRKILLEISNSQLAQGDLFEGGCRMSLGVRMKDSQVTEDSVLTDVRSCGVLVKETTRLNYFKFAHKSFLEVLVSAYVANSVSPVRSEDTTIVNIISRALDLKYDDVNMTDEVCSFTSDLLISSDKFNESYPYGRFPVLSFKKLIPVSILRNFPKFAIYLVFIMGSLSGSSGVGMGLLSMGVSVAASFGVKYEGNIYAMALVVFVTICFCSLRLIDRKILKIQKLIKIWYRCCKESSANVNVVDKYIGRDFAKYILEFKAVHPDGLRSKVLCFVFRR